MATHRDSYQRMLRMLGDPDTDYPSFEMCLEWQLMAVDTFAKEITRSGEPTLIDSFTISVSSSETEKTIPRDDFQALFHAFDTSTNRPVPVINFADAERWGVAGPPNTAGAGLIAALGHRGIGEGKRLMIYPPGAAGELKVYYLRGINQNAGPSDAIELLDDFHLVLLPASVGLYGIELWTWSKATQERQEAIRRGFLNERNPMSLLNVFRDQRKLFLERIYQPFVPHATNQPTSAAAQNQAMRFVNPWGQ